MLFYIVHYLNCSISSFFILTIWPQSTCTGGNYIST